MKKHLLLIAIIALAVMLSSCFSWLKPIWPSFDPPDLTQSTTTTEKEEEKPLVPAVGLEYELLTDSESGEKYYSVVGRGTCKDEHILIPNEYKGLPIKAIGDEAFLNDTELKGITLSENIISIGDVAFAGTSITKFEVPDSVIECGILVFAFSPVEELVLGKNAPLELGTFACSTALKTIVVDEEHPYLKVRDNVLYAIEDDMLALVQYPTGSDNRSFTLPEEVIALTPFAFSCANNLEEVTLPGTQLMMMYPFMWCDNLKTVNYNISSADILLSDEDTMYQEYALMSLTDIVIEKTSGMGWEIAGVSKMTIADFDIVFSDQTLKGSELKDLYKKMQNGSEGLEYELVYGSTDAEVNHYVVVGRGTCTDEEIFIPRTYMGYAVTEIADEAFLNDTSLKAIHLSQSITKIGDLAFAGSALTELVIPDNVTEVGGVVIAFAPVERLVIGSGITPQNLLDSPFACSTALKEIVVSDDNSDYYVEHGVLYANIEESEGVFRKVLIQYPTASEETSFTVPSDVYAVWLYAFSCVKNLEEITIPSTVIPYQCFFWSDSLKKINYDIVLDDVIGSHLFLYTFTDYFVKGETLEPSINGVSNISIPNYTLVYDGGEITKEGIDAIIEDMMSE